MTFCNYLFMIKIEAEAVVELERATMMSSGRLSGIRKTVRLRLHGPLLAHEYTGERLILMLEEAKSGTYLG